MIIAIMQPYFFPYIGYWQLIHAADRFILFDDAQYMRHGWINRNRILKPGGGWQYIVIPLQKHDARESIKNIKAQPGEKWKELIVRQLAHYRKKAEYFEETSAIVTEILESESEQSITAINLAIIKRLCAALDIDTEIAVSSRQNFDYSRVTDPGEWALRMAEEMGASEYINPASGAELFDPKKFLASNIKLSFLKTKEINYPQYGGFESSLSIIDVMMFNGIQGTKAFLNEYLTYSGEQS